MAELRGQPYDGAGLSRRPPEARGAMLVPGPLLRYYCVASSGGHDPITGCARDIEQAAGVFVNHHRIAARDAGESSHDFVGENVLGFAGTQLMANECDDFVRAELLEAKAGDEQPLGGPRAEGRLLQLREEVGARRGVPSLAEPR